MFGQRAPYQVVSYESTSRTATPTAVTHVNSGNFNAVQIFVSCTVDGAAASIVFNFDTWNSKTNTWVEVLESAAVADVGETVYQIGGVGAAVTNVATVVHPGRKIRIRPVHADADAITYSVTTSWLWA
jgi:hypothetical protein